MLLIERGQTPLVVAATAAPAAGYPKVSKSGSAFVKTTNAAQSLGEGFWGVQLTVQETGQLGTLVVVFGSGTGIVVQIRDLVSEISQEVGALVRNSQQVITKQVAASGAEQNGLVRDTLGVQVTQILQSLRPRRSSTGA